MNTTTAPAAFNTFSIVGPGIACDGAHGKCHNEAVTCLTIPSELLSAYLCDGCARRFDPEVAA